MPYAIGASARYSTTNGPAGQVHWEESRNVYLGAERLRCQADRLLRAVVVGVLPDPSVSFSPEDVGGRVTAAF